jgi:hypothetical protein
MPKEAVSNKPIWSRVFPRNQGDDQGPRKKAWMLLTGAGAWRPMMSRIRRIPPPRAITVPKAGPGMSKR